MGAPDLLAHARAQPRRADAQSRLRPGRGGGAARQAGPHPRPQPAPAVAGVERPAVAVRSELAPRPGSRQSREALIELVGDAHFVLLGEASHGTHEFYAERAQITRCL